MRAPGSVVPVAVLLCALLCLLVVQDTRAGFACLSNPCMFGVCLDDLNSSYACFCIDGYTGVLCQTNWDECWSSPCKNGGTCVDGVAQYNCTCPDGFRGEDCEENIDECMSNPCQNNGTCWDVDNGYSCSCVPGYLGAHCELDVAVCNATGAARCRNGAQCMEGPGLDFYCRCQPGWEGILCETEIDECASNPCQNGGVCVDKLGDYSCACYIGYTGRDCERPVLECADSPCENGALCLMEADAPRCYCVPDYHGERCDQQYDECQLGPRCANGGTCIDGVDGFTCSCPRGITGLLCECLELQYGLLDCTYVRPNISTTETTVTTRKTTITTTELTTTSTELTTIPYTTETTALTTPTTTPETTTEAGTTPLETTTLETTTEEITTTELTTTVPSTTEQLIIIPATKMNEITTTEGTTKQPETTTTEVTTVASDTTTALTTETTVSTTDISRFFTDDPGAIPGGKTSPMTPEVTTQAWTPTEATTADAATMSTSSNVIGCKDLYCANGGSCFSSSGGAKCVCTFKFTGPTCTTPVRIQSAAFGGTSYLSHRLPGPSAGKLSRTEHGLDVEVQARTLSPDGLLLHASIQGDTAYMTVYLRAGLLRFRFSCGVQTMVLGETQKPVNDGNELGIRARLDFNANHTQCNASLRINDTLAMSGHQQSRFASLMPGLPWQRGGGTWLHLGGAPESAADQGVEEERKGFVGCMRGLKVDGKEAHIFKEALGGSEVAECSAFACLSSPCLNGAGCHQSGDSWHCACKSGFTGRSCERSACSNNPCLFGATCAPFPGSGFICLCPLGKHGQFCEHNLEIAQPSFATTLNGMSSYVAYPINGPIAYNMELHLKVVPRTQEQISLIAFMGQPGVHNQGSDHLAISYVKGYFMLTWNLGSGARRIFTSRPVAPLADGLPHVVRAGRTARRAWLWVEGVANVTGRSPGHLQKLDVDSTLYIGGHESRHFAPLPHDLPLHGGFFGCIYDVELRAGRSAPQSVQDTRLAHGRGVGRCLVSECHAHACSAGSACLQHGAAFACLCSPGRAGPRCDTDSDPCGVGEGAGEGPPCHPDAQCVPRDRSEAQCDCPMGRHGIRCDKVQNISDASFSGVRSYLALPPGPLLGPQYIVRLELRPLAEQGIVLFSGNAAKGFVCLSLQGGVLELRVKASTGKITTIRSGRVLANGEWHRVRITRYGRRVNMWAEGVANTGTVQYSENTGVFASEASNRIYIGGLPDLSDLPFGAVSGFPVAFRGCIRNLHLNAVKIALNSTNVREARNVGDCDGTACGADMCDNGVCVLSTTPGGGPVCECPRRHEGARCERSRGCSETRPCERGGRCVRSPAEHESQPDGKCECPPGATGRYCDEVLQPGAVQFSGNSYLKTQNGNSFMKDKRSKGTLKIPPDVINDSVNLNFSTIQQDGLIIWCAQGEKFTGVGIEAGYLKLVTSSLGSVRTLIPVSDGEWHYLNVAWINGEVHLWVDQQVLFNQTTLIDEICGFGDVYIGGFPYNQSTEMQTEGAFLESFSGCLQELTFGEENSIDFTKTEGENLEMCEWI